MPQLTEELKNILESLGKHPDQKSIKENLKNLLSKTKKQEIKEFYRALALMLHPDKTTSTVGLNAQDVLNITMLFKTINNYYKESEAVRGVNVHGKIFNDLKQVVEGFSQTHASAPRASAPRASEPRASEPRTSAPHVATLLTKEQITLARAYFAVHPEKNKMSKKEGKLPYSVVKSAEGKLYALHKQPEGHAKPGLDARLTKFAQCLDAPYATVFVNIVETDHTKNIESFKDIVRAAGRYAGSQSIHKPDPSWLNWVLSSPNHKTKHYVFANFIEGEPLSTYFANNQAVPTVKKVEILIQVLEQLKNLHSQGVVSGNLEFKDIIYNSVTGAINIDCNILHKSEPGSIDYKHKSKEDVANLGREIFVAFAHDHNLQKIIQFTDLADPNVALSESVRYLKQYSEHLKRPHAAAPDDAAKKAAKAQAAEAREKAVLAARQAEIRKAAEKRLHEEHAHEARAIDPNSFIAHPAQLKIFLQQLMRNSRIIAIPVGGDCLYAAVGSQLGKDVRELRSNVADYIQIHIAEYRDIIEAQLIVNPKYDTLSKYLHAIKHTNEPAEELELAVLMKLAHRPICVINTANGEKMNIVEVKTDVAPIFVAYDTANRHYSGVQIPDYNKAIKDFFAEDQQAAKRPRR